MILFKYQSIAGYSMESFGPPVVRGPIDARYTLGSVDKQPGFLLFSEVAHDQFSAFL